MTARGEGITVNIYLIILTWQPIFDRPSTDVSAPLPTPVASFRPTLPQSMICEERCIVIDSAVIYDVKSDVHV